MVARLIILLTLLALACPSHAVTFVVANGAARIKLRIGTGDLASQATCNNAAGDNGTIDIVSFVLTLANVGNGVAVVGAPTVVVAACARSLAAAPRTATLTANSTTALNNGSGSTIPFTQISWTAAGDTDIPAGTFTGAAGQVLASFTTSGGRTATHTFSYANTNVVAAGTYTGRVTYTLTMP